MIAALALVGCDKKNSSNSTDAPTTNSVMSDASGLATNSVSYVNTNLPATTNK
jgi:hypothetical protein